MLVMYVELFILSCSDLQLRVLAERLVTVGSFVLHVCVCIYIYIERERERHIYIYTHIISSLD